LGEALAFDDAGIDAEEIDAVQIRTPDCSFYLTSDV